MRFAPFFIIPGAFSAVECAAIDELARGLSVEAAHVTGGQGAAVSDEIRRARLRWIFPDGPAARDLHAKVDAIMTEANELFWRFDLAAADRPIQYTEYGEPGAHYAWHMDWGDGLGLRRKLSITVQLCDASDYEGGDLEFMGYPCTETGRRQIRARGSAIVFPAFMQHRVAPVISGERRSLVTWRSGPTAWR